MLRAQIFNQYLANMRKVEDFKILLNQVLVDSQHKNHPSLRNFNQTLALVFHPCSLRAHQKVNTANRNSSTQYNELWASVPRAKPAGVYFFANICINWQSWKKRGPLQNSFCKIPQNAETSAASFAALTALSGRTVIRISSIRSAKERLESLFRSKR